MGRIVPDISRRAVMGGASLLLPLPASAQIAAARAIRALEKSSGARIGLAAIDTGSARSLFNRESQRFMMCSSFKLSLAAAMLARADRGTEHLDRVIHYSKAQLLPVSPATTRSLATGMTIRDLCEAICIYSDNTGANLLLAEIGGPAQLTRFWRGLGDETTRLDRIESALNVPDGDKDTTTPAAMLGNLKAMLLGEALSPASRALLLTWMRANTTGTKMLRAGLPADWNVGDKTGHWISSTNLDAAAVNDLAIITPPGRKPILAVALTRGGSPDDDIRVKLLADIGRVLADAFA
ncbi:MAG TPA: class A beta-lactamase [Rhizomicrobium sp.]|jgi:beta-lactamase class A